MVDPVSRLVAANLQVWRAVRGLSAQGLADRCAELGYPHLDRTLIAKIESRKKRRRVLVDELAVFARALGVTAGHLLDPKGPTLAEIGYGHDRDAGVLAGSQDRDATIAEIVHDLEPDARWVVDARQWLRPPQDGETVVATFKREMELRRLLVELARVIESGKPDTDKEK